jgi:hypothetical protein
MGRTAVLSGNLYVFYRRMVMRVLITSQAALPPDQLRLCVPTASAPAARTVEPERGEAAAPLRPSIHRSAWRNCLENSRGSFESASSAASSGRSGPFDPSWPPPEPLFRDTFGFSKQFRKGYFPKFG